MRKLIAVCSLYIFCASIVTATAADKSKSDLLIDAANAAITAATAKAGDSKTIATDLESARNLLKKAEEARSNGKSLFGLGSLKPEAEQAISHYTGLAELNVLLADSHLTLERARIELDPLERQLAAVKTKVKFFEERKAEIEKLRSDAAKYQISSKELEILKTDTTKLSGQLETLRTEKQVLSKKVEVLTLENNRLTTQVEKLQTAAAQQPVLQNTVAPAVPAAGSEVPLPASIVPPPETAPLPVIPEESTPPESVQPPQETTVEQPQNEAPQPTEAPVAPTEPTPEPPVPEQQTPAPEQLDPPIPPPDQNTI